jgi:pimeloyl-ACP methyl ester carboxylesterase
VDPVTARLRARYEVLRCDLRGQFFSPGKAPVGLAGHAEDVLRLLDSLSVESFHLVGASFGGLIGVWLAAKHPDRVLSLTALTVADRLSATAQAMGQAIARTGRAELTSGGGDGVFDLFAAGTFSPAFRERHAEALALRRRHLRSLDPSWIEGLLALWSSVENMDLRPELPHIACPTLVVAAEGDVVYPPSECRVAERISGARFATIADSGHALVIEAGAVARWCGVPGGLAGRERRAKERTRD